MKHAADRILVLFVLLFAVSLVAQQPKIPSAASRRATSDIAPAVAPAAATGVTTAGGVNGYLPVFTGASTVVDSIVYQGVAGVGIGRIPNATLDVNGKSIFRGGQVLSRVGDATPSAGSPSYGLIVQSSVYNTTNKSNLLPYYQLQSEPTGNNTATTGATYNFLYYSGQGANPVETGLYFNPNGTIHFAPSQTFPTVATGPQGPAGPAGPTGPSGPALALPYSASKDGMGGTVFSIYNIGGGGGTAIQGAGAATMGGVEGGTGIFGQGGQTSTTPGQQLIAGTGVAGTGGQAINDSSYGGDGGYFVGGYAISGSLAGPGLSAYGGDAQDTNNGAAGAGIVAGHGANGFVAAEFDGEVIVDGTLVKQGGSFKIDHPLDPANKYLSHSFVESPDMMNIYNGNVVTNGGGVAVVTLPDWFEALNRDFRYQLTAIGQPAMAYVAVKIANGAFTIKTDRPDVEVSWQVTGVRQDAWANAHRIPIEEEKPTKEKGHYTHPELFGHAGELSVFEMKHPRPDKTRQQ